MRRSRYAGEGFEQVGDVRGMLGRSFGTCTDGDCMHKSCKGMLGVMESYGGECLVTDNVEAEFVNFKVTLDSGAVDHVTPSDTAPGYEIKESAASRAGGGFIAANGDHIPNEGQVTLSLEADSMELDSTFQVADITQSLWSVGKICDAGTGHEIHFKKDKAVVIDAVTRRELFSIGRETGGLYKGDLRLRNPRYKGNKGQGDFHRQGR